MEQFYGPHNIEQRKIHYQPRLREYTVDEAMGHVREAMRRNAIVSAFENEGKSKVTENFDGKSFYLIYILKFNIFSLCFPTWKRGRIL